MNEEVGSLWHQERMFDEQMRRAMPVVFAVLMALGVAGALLAWDTVWTSGYLIGSAFMACAFFRPEFALLAVTVIAPLEIYTYEMGTLIPGTGLTPVNAIALLLVAGAWTQRYSPKPPAAPATQLDKPLLWFVAWSAFSVLVGIVMWGLDALALGEWMSMVTGLLMYWTVRRRWRSVKLAPAAVIIVMVMVAFESFQVIRQYHGMQHDVFNWHLKDVITGTFPSGNSNDIGCYLSAYGLLGLGLFLGMRKSLWRWPALAVFFLAGAAMFDTYSRAAFWGMMAGMLCVTLIKHRRWLIVAVAFMILLPSLLPGSIQERINTHGDQSAESRKEFWKNGISVMLTNPVGVGWRGYSKHEAARHQEIRDTHNMYVLVGAEQGVVGLGLFLATLIIAGRVILQANKRAKTPFAEGLSVGLFGALIAFAVNNIFGSRMVFFYSIEHFWFLLGILVVITQPKPGEMLVEVEAPKPAPKKELAGAGSFWRYRDI